MRTATILGFPADGGEASCLLIGDASVVEDAFRAMRRGEEKLPAGLRKIELWTRRGRLKTFVVKPGKTAVAKKAAKKAAKNSDTDIFDEDEI